MPSHEVQVQQGGLLSPVNTRLHAFGLTPLHGQGAKPLARSCAGGRRSQDGLVEAASVHDHHFRARRAVAPGMEQ